MVSSKGTGYLGGFDTNILSKRLQNLFRDVLHTSKVYHPNVKKLNVFMLGDIIDGSTIFESQLRQIDMNSIQQIVYVVEQLSSHINDLAGHFEEIVIHCVCGNHGRLGKKGVNDPLDNLDYLVYWMIKERLSANKRVRLVLPESWFTVVDVMGWNFLLTHGDDILSWMSIPVYGMIRYRYKMTELISPTPLHYIVMGDKHTALDFIASGLIMNGCAPGGSEFSLKKMQVGGLPVQLFFGVSRTYGKTWMRALALEIPNKISAIKVSH